MVSKLTPDQIRDLYTIKDRSPFYLPIKDILGEAYQNLASPPPSMVLEDYPAFMKTIGGFRPKEFSILCGSTGVGKTTFIAGLSASMIKQNIPHYVASVETGSEDYVRRIISVFAQQDINTGEAFSKDFLYSIHKRYGSQLSTSSLQLALYENRTSVEELMSDIISAHHTHGIKLAIIDNLNFFMEVTNSANAIIEMDRVVHELIIFCKQVNVHVIMIMHPKKNSTNSRDTRVESEFEIKGSSLAVQEAHNIFLLNRPKQEDVDSGICDKYDRELKIAKMRRMGKATGRRIIFGTSNGVSYVEKRIEE